MVAQWRRLRGTVASPTEPRYTSPSWLIGYAVAYPITVLLTIVACSYLISAGKRKPTAEDREKLAPIVVRTLELVGDPGCTVREFEARHQAQHGKRVSALQLPDGGPRGGEEVRILF